MIKIDDGIIVVEGRDDKTALLRVIDANIFVLNGANGVNKKNIDMLKKLSMNNKIYLLTDPDFTGKKIRQILNDNIDGLVNLYSKRSLATKNNNIGIENLSDDDILDIFKNIRVKSDNKEYIFTIQDIMDNNLNSKLKRQILGDILNISYQNSKQLINMLNSLNISKDEFDNAVIKTNEIMKIKKYNGAIFGKFFPIHLGHVHFIKQASLYVEKLYVFVGIETNRDKKLNETSNFPKLSQYDRLNFVKSELKGYKNIQILPLNEDGIEPYPNGWENWSKRVLEVAKDNNINFNVIFTNETQDKAQYEKYFNMIVWHIDTNREEFNISATKIRQNPKEYIDFLPESVKNFYIKNGGN